jgi:lysophospholipase L1-like esterase
MEIEVAKYLATVEADCFVLDCIPNQTPEQVSERALPFIKYLRAQRPKTPIIIVETVIRETGHFDQQLGKYVQKQNENIRRVYDQLKNEKYKGIYYIPANKFTGTDHEATIDGTHFTDLGFSRIATAVIEVIKKVM